MAVQMQNVPQLVADNFNNWKFRIKAILEEKQVLEALEKEVDDFTDEKQKNDFQLKDAKAKSIIVQCTSDKHLDLIKNSKTAKQMMKALQDVFERKSVFTKLHLKKKLLSLKCSVDDKLEDHFQKFDVLIRDLENAGSKQEETDKICHLLLTMNANYDAVITAIETLPPSTEITMEFVKCRLLDEELKMDSKKDERKKNSFSEILNNEASFNTTQQTTCFHCKKTGHKFSDCWLRSKTNVRRGRGRGNRSRGFIKRGQSQQGTYENAHHSHQADEEISFVAFSCGIEDENTFILDSGATSHLISEKMETYMTKVEKLPVEVKIKTANGEAMNAQKQGRFEGICQGRKIYFQALLVKGIKNNLLSVAKLVKSGHEVIFNKESVIVKSHNFDFHCEIGPSNLFLLKIVPAKADIMKGLSAAEDQNIWHRRLGHLNVGGLKILGLPYTTKKCSICIEGKSTRRIFAEVQKNSKQIGDLIHSDICGPINPPTPDGERYFQVLIDDYSHFLIVKLLKTKDEAEQNIIDFIKFIKTQHGLRTKKLRLDNGGEFSSNFFKSWCSSKGIQLQYTTPYSPMQNGTSERMNRTLMNRVRTKFAETKLPKYLWGEAILCSAYELNRCPTTANKNAIDWIPAAIWYKMNDLSKLKIFGSKAWRVTLPKGNKLDSRATPAIMVGYCGGGYRLWDYKNNKVIRSTDVIFDETDTEYDEENVTDLKAQGINEDYENEEGIEQKKDEMEINNKEITQTRSGRIVSRPHHLDEYEVYTTYCLLTDMGDPLTFEEAHMEEEWKIAIQKEIDSHKKLGTWTITNLPSGKKAIDTKWVFRTKEDGTKKARLVAKGFQVQEESMNTMYAPVARMSTIRMLFAEAIQNDWNIRQMDIPTAFLNGTIESEIYIKIPEGVEIDNSRVLKLNRALYGLKESPKSWNNKFNQVTLEYGFRRSNYDFCLYCGDQVWLIVFVDDILLTGSIRKIENAVKWLKLKFNAKDMGNVSNFLGMQIVRNDDHLLISQTKLIEKVLENFNMSDCREASTPMEVGFQIDPDQAVIDVPYRQIIGSLMYLATSTRPDIMFPVAYLSRVLDKPSVQTWKAAKRILRYLQSTKTLGLKYKKSNLNRIESFSDADWAADKTDRKSVSGNIVLYGENAVSWFSKKQDCVALSTAEAEYVAAAAAAQELIYLKGVLSEFMTECDTVLFIDNLSTIAMSKSYENSKRVKHIDIRQHFIKDLIIKKIIDVDYVSTNQNIADFMTKPLCKEKFLKFRVLAGIVAE